MESTSSAPTCAAAVANAFLDIQAADHSSFPPIDQMKMQKLVFYSQAWWLAYTDTELFPDDIEAWPWGPVVRSIYGDFIAFGRQPISPTARATVIQSVGPGPLDVRMDVPAPPAPDVVGYLKQVWEKHKAFTGIQLSNATHLPGEPWTIVKEQIGDLGSKPRIPNSLIRDVFKKKLQQVQPA